MAFTEYCIITHHQSSEESKPPRLSKLASIINYNQTYPVVLIVGSHLGWLGLNLPLIRDERWLLGMKVSNQDWSKYGTSIEKPYASKRKKPLNHFSNHWIIYKTREQSVRNIWESHRIFMGKTFEYHVSKRIIDDDWWPCNEGKTTGHSNNII